MKKLGGVILLVLGCIIALFIINCVVAIHFGMQYYFLLLAAEFIICGLFLIKFCDK